MLAPWINIKPEDAESQSRGIVRRLVELEDALKSHQTMARAAPDSFAVRLGTKSLTSMHARLSRELAQLAAYRQAEHVNVELAGRAFTDHTASLAHLGALFLRLQKLYTSIGQSLRSGPRLRGPFPGELRTSTELRLASVYPASFGMNLYVPSSYDLMGESIAADSLSSLFQLLRSAQNEPELMQLSGELGRRAITHLRHIAVILRDTESELRVDWKDYTGTRHRWVADTPMATAIISNVEKISETRAEEKRITGHLVGASLLRSRFEFITHDFDLIEGKFVTGLDGPIRAAFGRKCTIVVDETEITDRSNGDSRTYYSLKALEDV